jgi:glycerol-1-phosphate dehydrogenase [NAD(P)+]
VRSPESDDQTADGPIFPTLEGAATETIGGVGSYTICVNDPPWSDIRKQVPEPARVVLATDMETSHLESLLEEEPDSETVIGLGGGSALDTAKFIAWKTGKKLVQIPGIASVDAAFTDAVGIRIDRNVRYVGQIFPDFVLLDIDLVRSAPKRLNRAGIGDVLSCHTGLWDWRLAAARNQGVPWDSKWAGIGVALLTELDEMADEVGAVTEDGVRWLFGAYQRIGSGCHLAGHSRFEEGSEHFFGYCYEWLTGNRQIHGELISLGVVAMAALQGNEVDRALSIVARAGTRGHPSDLGISRAQFGEVLTALPKYVRDQQLDYSIIDVAEIQPATVNTLWEVLDRIPTGTT